MISAPLLRFAHVSKALIFTLAIHGALLALLLYSFNWVDDIERGGVDVIQASVVSEDDIRAQVEKDQAADAARRAEQQKAAAAVEELKRQQEQAKKELAEIEQRKQREREQAAAAEQQRKEEERKRLEAEEKRRAEEARQKQLEAERRAAEEVERKRQAEEKKRIEAEKKRLAEEARKKAEAEAARRQAEAEEKRRREALQKQVEAEEKRQAEAARAAEAARRAQIRADTKADAEQALSAMTLRIRDAVQRNWRRPPVSKPNLTALIQVRVKPNGEVISANILRGSGDPLFDESAVIAVKKASPLPFPDAPRYYEFINKFNFKFAPDDG